MTIAYQTGVVMSPDGSSAPANVRRRRIVVAIVGLLVLASALVGWWAWHTTSIDRTASDLADQRRADSRRDTRSLESRRTSTLRTIAALEGGLRARTADRDAHALSLFVVTGQLNEAKETLVREASGLQALEARVGALQSCLQGVDGALNALSIGDTNTALSRLRAVGSDCDAAG